MDYSAYLIAFFLPFMLIICLFINKLSTKIGFPSFIAFIIVGMLLGKDGPLHIEFNNFILTEYICDFAVGFITFIGGFEVKFSKAKKVLPQALVMSSLGVLFTSVILAIFIHLIFRASIPNSLLFGAILGSTDATSVFNVLKRSKLNLKYNTAPLLEVESGSNDPMAYTLLTIFTLIFLGHAEGLSIIFFKQYIFGALVGTIIALIMRYVLTKIKFDDDTTHSLIMVLLVPIAISISNAIGANSLLSLYIMGIILGNSDFSKNKSLIVNFLDSINSLSQMIIFFLMGLLVTPHLLPSYIGNAIIIFLLITFIARPLTSFILLLPFRAKINQILFISAAGLRGASSIIFSIYLSLSINNAQTVATFNTIFIVVILSLLLQGNSLPFLAKKLNMIDKNENVLETFTA